MELNNYKWYQVVKKMKLWLWRRQNTLIADMVAEEVIYTHETCYACGNFNDYRLAYDSIRIRCLDCGSYWDDPSYIESPGMA